MKETLLVVEDNITLLEGLRDILSLEGFNVLTASNGQEALDQMGTLAPDMIISDIAMPVMDGFAFCTALKADPETAFIPVLLLTARAAQSDRRVAPVAAAYRIARPSRTPTSS